LENETIIFNGRMEAWSKGRIWQKKFNSSNFYGSRRDLDGKVEE
jgi:hypothetical protein